ncbi:aspartic-type endopeptidase [Emydomyces testavorans]|uniref:Probable aspartic-type endopeptidase CTSD n=1 Tax=Emydomyces testavorans TaxID=2070801 RepID=A0AAF0DC13_9EURO|nr:aspartic-type endopeptidase [Emydomyces testavorans]
MLLLPWCLYASILLTGVSAFYPVRLPKEDVPSPPGSSRRRFFPVPPLKTPLQDEKTPLKLDLVKVPSTVRRDNKYNAIMGNKPTMENSTAINQDGKDFSYFSIIKFGSKGQDMWMLLDSGAAESWVMDSNCTAAACLKHNTFGVEDSNTLSVTNQKWQVTYGTGRVEGVIVKDTLSMAGFQLQFDFGSALNASDDFLNYPMDGILGLGPSNTGKITPFFQVIAERKMFNKTILGINLQRAADGDTDGQLTFGAVDKTKFTGDITYTNIIKDTNRWEIPIDDAIVDGKPLKFTKKSAVIDTGTSFILMPMKDAEAFHALIPGSKKSDTYFTVPCDTKVSVEFVISGVKWMVSPKDYVGSGKDNICNSYILGRQPLGPDQWLLGDAFLKNVYTVLDYDDSRIGFASRRYPGPSTTDKSTSPKTATTTQSDMGPTVSPVPPRDANANSSKGSSQPTGSMADKKGAAALLGPPGWLSLALLFSTGYSWYLSSFRIP